MSAKHIKNFKGMDEMVARVVFKVLAHSLILAQMN